jgi:ubiquinone/menaquinone biosynthesis C-methylase UbiE/DNA-binding XRE family transcriptional regulator
MINKIETGNRIAALRKTLKYSQPQFAEQLGVSTQAVSKWETGVSLPDLEMLLKISWMCQTSINNILEDVEFSLANALTCPTCHATMKLMNGVYYKCENGCKFYIKDGVVDFGTREILGEQWSLGYRNYDEYLHEHHWPNNPNYDRGLDYNQLRVDIVHKLRPRVILDVACGTGQGIKHIIKHADYPVTVIMADLSHRILKWNNIYYSDEWHNPYVKMIYLTCDCANLPLCDGCVDMVFSNYGFESMQDKMMDGFKEAYRVLKPGGHALYNISVVNSFDSKWLQLNNYNCKLYDIDQWLDICRAVGYIKNDPVKIYGELPPPIDEVFPFDHEVLQWMAQYIVTSYKKTE